MKTMKYLTLILALLLNNIVHSYNEKSNNTIYKKVDLPAKFPSGDFQFKSIIYDNLQLIINKESPKPLFVKMVINENGSIGDVTTLSNNKTNFDNEVIKIIKAMPHWIPGKLNGKNVTSEIVQYIAFSDAEISQVYSSIINQKYKELNNFINTKDFFMQLYAKPFLSKKELVYFGLKIDSLVNMCNESIKKYPKYLYSKYVYNDITIEDFKGQIIAYKHFIFKLHKQNNQIINDAFPIMRTQIVKYNLKNTQNSASIITYSIENFWAYYYINETEKINPSLKIFNPKLYLHADNWKYFKSIMNFESVLNKKTILELGEFKIVHNFDIKTTTSFEELTDSLLSNTKRRIDKIGSISVKYLNTILNDIALQSMNLEDFIVLDFINQSKNTIILDNTSDLKTNHAIQKLLFFTLTPEKYTSIYSPSFNDSVTNEFLINFVLPKDRLNRNDQNQLETIQKMYELSLIKVNNSIIFNKYITIFPISIIHNIRNINSILIKILFENNKHDEALFYLKNPTYINTISISYTLRYRNLLCFTPQQYLQDVIEILEKQNLKLNKMVFTYNENNKKGLRTIYEKITDAIFDSIDYDSMPYDHFKVTIGNKNGIMSSTGKVIIPALYDSIIYLKKTSNKQNYFYITKNNSSIQLINFDGDTIVTNDTVDLKFINEKYVSFIATKNKKQIIYYYHNSEKSIYQVGRPYDYVELSGSSFLNSKFYIDNKPTYIDFKTEFKKVKTITSVDPLISRNYKDVYTKITSDTIKTKSNKLKDSDSTLAEFPGGDEKLNEYLKANLKYPKPCFENGIQGKVYVKFTVMKDGTIKDITLLKKVHPMLDKEAIRIVENMPKWTPKTLKGQPVDSYFILPLGFYIT
jgi:periplasmic protein TonB